MGGTDTADLYGGFADYLIPFPYIVLVILLALPLAAVAGFRFGEVEYRRGKYQGTSSERVPGDTSLGAMLALLGLLLGFAFSSTLGWREARQEALVEEAMAIGTAFLTADLLADPGRRDLQNQLLAYAETRLARPADIADKQAWNRFLERTLEAQSKLWPTTQDAIGEEMAAPIRVAVARSVTDVLDSHTRRLSAAAEQLPNAAKLMIFVAALAAVLIIGNRTALQGRSLTWRTFVFSGLLSIVMIVIVDLDRTLEGLIRLNTDTLAATVREMDAALDAPRTESAGPLPVFPEARKVRVPRQGPGEHEMMPECHEMIRLGRWCAGYIAAIRSQPRGRR